MVVRGSGPIGGRVIYSDKRRRSACINPGPLNESIIVSPPPCRYHRRVPEVAFHDRKQCSTNRVHNRAEFRRKALDEGAVDFLCKPFNAAGLLEVIEAAPASARQK